MSQELAQAVQKKSSLSRSLKPGTASCMSLCPPTGNCSVLTHGRSAARHHKHDSQESMQQFWYQGWPKLVSLTESKAAATTRAK